MIVAGKMWKRVGVVRKVPKFRLMTRVTKAGKTVARYMKKGFKFTSKLLKIKVKAGWSKIKGLTKVVYNKLKALKKAKTVTKVTKLKKYKATRKLKSK